MWVDGQETQINLKNENRGPGTGTCVPEYSGRVDTIVKDKRSRGCAARVQTAADRSSYSHHRCGSLPDHHQRDHLYDRQLRPESTGFGTAAALNHERGYTDRCAFFLWSTAMSRRLASECCV